MPGLGGKSPSFSVSQAIAVAPGANAYNQRRDCGTGSDLVPDA